MKVWRVVKRQEGHRLFQEAWLRGRQQETRATGGEGSDKGIVELLVFIILFFFAAFHAFSFPNLAMKMLSLFCFE